MESMCACQPDTLLSGGISTPKMEVERCVLTIGADTRLLSYL
jgi:hypothetical protein